MSDSFSKLFSLFLERRSDAANWTVSTPEATVSLTVGADTDGAIKLSWPHGHLTIPAQQREAFLAMVEKAVKMSQQAVPHPAP